MPAPERDLPRCLLVKLGGSLITDKQGHRSVRRQILRSLAADLAEFLRESPEDVRVVLGHGSGSYGHAAAAGTALDPRHSESGSTVRSQDLVAAAVRTQEAAADLHRLVIEELLAAGVPAFSLAPGSFLVTRDGDPDVVFPEPLRGALRTGASVVVRGDVAIDRRKGFCIVSTETVLLALAEELADEVELLGALWLGETAGLLDDEGATVAEVDVGADVDRLIGETRGTDVTGGMAHRVAFARRLAARGVPSLLMDGRQAGRLKAGLEHLLHASGDALEGATLVPAVRASRR